MRFLDDNDKEKENINGAECERKQGNDEGSSLQLMGQNVNENKAMTKVVIAIIVYFLYYRGIQMHREVKEGKVRRRRGREREREREGVAYGPGSNSVLFNLFDPVLMIIILSTM